MKNFFLDIFQNPLFQNIEASSIGKVLAWLLAIGSVGAVCGFMPLWMQSVYFVALALSLGYVLIGGIHFNGKYLTLYIVLVLNVLILPIDPVFNSKMRLLLFTVVTMVVSSALVTKRAVVFRNMVFKNVLILCSILVPISCLCRFLGLNYARMVVSSDMNGFVWWIIPTLNDARSYCRNYNYSLFFCISELWTEENLYCFVYYVRFGLLFFC